MLGDVLRRPMFMQAGGMTMPMPMPAQPMDNVGIMDGFAQGQPMENPIDQAKDYAGLMNLIRGNEASVEDRREELSQIVGRTDAMKTPESVLTLVQPTLAQFEQSAQAQQGIGSMPEAQQMMQGAGDMGQGADQQLAQDQQEVDMAQMTGQPVTAQEGLFTGVGGRTFYVNPTGGITTALPTTLPATIPQANVPAIRPIPGVPALGTNVPGLGMGASYNLGAGTAGITGTTAASSIPPFLQPTSGAAVGGGGNIPRMTYGQIIGGGDALRKIQPYLAASPFSTAIGLGLGAAEIGKLPGKLTDSGYEVEGGEEEKFIKDFGADILGKETSTGEAISSYYIEKNKKRLADLKKRNAPGDKEAAAKLEKIIESAEPKKEPKKTDTTVPPPEKKFKARSIDEILNSEGFKKTQKAYEKLYGYDPDFLKGQAYQQLAQFGLNLASAKGGNAVQKIAEAAKSPLATFAAIGAEAQKAKREGRLEAGKGAIKEAEFEKKIEQYADYGITPKEAILGAKTGDLKDLENARTAIQTGYGSLINKLPKEQRAIVTENAAAIYKQEPTTAGLKKAEKYIVSIIKGE
jgi:hypothetical protein